MAMSFELKPELWDDPRFETLRNLCGSREMAIGVYVCAGKRGIECWKNYELIPFKMYKHLLHFKELILAGLAELVVKSESDLIGGLQINFWPKKDSDQGCHSPSSPHAFFNPVKFDPNQDLDAYEHCYVYIKGGQKFFTWVHRDTQKGVRSAQVREQKYGTAQPPNGRQVQKKAAHDDGLQQNKESNQNRTGIEPASNRIEASISIPISISKNTNTNMLNSSTNLPTEASSPDSPKLKLVRQVFDFEMLYRQYPRKVGKGRGLKICHREIKSAEDYELLKLAIFRYRDYVSAQKTEEKYIKHFSSFMNEWRDWTDETTGKALKTKNSILDADLEGILRDLKRV